MEIQTDDKIIVIYITMTLGEVIAVALFCGCVIAVANQRENTMLSANMGTMILHSSYTSCACV